MNGVGDTGRVVTKPRDGRTRAGLVRAIKTIRARILASVTAATSPIPVGATREDKVLSSLMADVASWAALSLAQWCDE